MSGHDRVENRTRTGIGAVLGECHLGSKTTPIEIEHVCVMAGRECLDRRHRQVVVE
jgi:hypothetical protein